MGARVTQIMRILDLPTPIVDYLAALLPEERGRFTERQLRRIRGLSTEEEQIRAFEELRGEVEEDAGSESAPPPGTSQGGQTGPHDVGDGT